MTMSRYTLACNVIGRDTGPFIHASFGYSEMDSGKHYATFTNSRGESKGPFLVRENKSVGDVVVEAFQDSTFQVLGVGYVVTFTGHLDNGKPYSATWAGNGDAGGSTYMTNGI